MNQLFINLYFTLRLMLIKNRNPSLPVSTDHQNFFLTFLSHTTYNTSI